MLYNQTKFAVLVPYFGKLPWYFIHFINSCYFNNLIKFYLITDNNNIGKLPLNVTKIYISIKDLNIIVSKKFNIHSNITGGYKFCDFKPAYGYIFYELIEEYEFWGQCDIDIILGDLSSFLLSIDFKQYDYINVRHDFVTGFFSIFRNSEKMNTLFMRSKDYKTVFSSEKHYCFDECNNVHEQITQGKSIFDCDTEIESFMHVLKKSEAEGEIKTFFDFICIEGTPGHIKYNKGTLTYKNKYEVILYHMILLKKKNGSIPNWKKIPDTFRISKDKIYR